MTIRWTDHDLQAYLRRDISAPITERIWQSTVMRVLKDAGYMTYHVYDSRRSPHGWPDVAAIKPTGGTLYLCELKTDAGIVSEAQQAWLAALGGCSGVVAEIWRPSGLEEICQRLRQTC